MEKRKQEQKQMKRNRIISPMRATMLLLLMGLVSGSTMAQFRLEPKHRAKGGSEGLYISKELKPDDNYPTGGVLYLESYVTGSVKKVQASMPTDIVLVLDRSSSMNSNMTTTYSSYTARTSRSYTYEGYGNNHYYFKDGDEYYAVYRFREAYYDTAALASQNYSYNGYGDHTYYYKDSDGNYYLVYRSSEPNGTYEALNTADYTYTSYGNNHFYYLDTEDNQYYEVSREREAYTTYNPRPSQWYTYSNCNNKHYFICPNGDDGYYEVFGYKNGNKYNLYYIKDEERHYLRDGNVTGQNTNIWEGVLYEQKTDVYRLSYTKNSTKYYLSGTTITTTPPINVTAENTTIYSGILYQPGNNYNLYYVKDGETIYLGTTATSNTATIYSGILYEISTKYYYRLYYTKNGHNIYLSDDTTTTEEPTNVGTTGGTIWTGVLYQGGTANPAVKRIDALKTAVRNFIRTIEEDAMNHPSLDEFGNEIPANHRISIVQFDKACQNVTVNGQTGLLDVWYWDETSREYKSNADSLIAAVNRITLGSGTRQDLGLNQAYQNLPTPDLPLEEYLRKNVVVLFTDGEPYGGGVDQNQCISAAYPLKQDPTDGKAATVYTVGTFSSSVTETNLDMMSYISSNYPDAQSLTNFGPRAKELKYSFRAENPDELSNIFESIAEESGGSIVDLGSEAVVQDVISDYFQLPKDPETGEPLIDSIKVYTAQCIGVNEEQAGTGNYDNQGREFDPMREVELAEPDEEGFHLRFTDNNTSVQVDGFNFKEEWCGMETIDGVAEAHGKKLILAIPIVAKPDAWGDDLPTNGELSVISDTLVITPEHIIDHFQSPHNTIHRDTWVEAVTSEPEDWDASNIDSPEDLAWLISVVNGYNGKTPAPKTNATVTANLDMSAYNWVPIGGTEGYYNYDSEGNPHFVAPTGTEGYTGIFNGGGHSIIGLRNQASKVFSPGLFQKVNGGTVKNTFVMDCEFNTGCEGYFGIIADTVCNGGVIYNCEAAGQLKSCDVETEFFNPRPIDTIPATYTREVDPLNIFLGGLVGLVDASEVHSCISVADIYGYNMGGLVNEIRDGGEGHEAAVENSYSYPTFYHWMPSQGGNVGGMVAVNKGKLLNCYIRERARGVGENPIGGIQYAIQRINSSHSKADKVLGLLVGNNDEGSASYCYVTDAWWSTEGTLAENFIGRGNDVTSYGKFSITETPYMYLHNDNQVTMLGAKDGEPATEGLLTKLNSDDWKATSKAATEYEYTSWFRTTADGINNDYPVLKIMDFNSVGSDDLIRLYYGDINHMMDSTSMYTSDIADDTYCIYQNVAVTTGNNNATLYINEDVAILQEKSLDAFVGITLDNSGHDGGNGTPGNNPNDPNPHNYPDNTRDWHMFATSLSNAPLGVNYTDNDQWPFEFVDPATGTQSMPQYPFYAESKQDGYFPSKTYGTGADYYRDWDYYCWSEPYNHWINFKRNSASHWAENQPEINLGYNNDTTLTPGKGYLLAIANETFLQSHGTLNMGDVSINLTNSPKNYYSCGFNLIGNPYQSYLDFSKFSAKNTSITSYTILDEDANGYLTYANGASKNTKAASQFINMHQGFLVYTESNITVTFTESMRDIKATDVTFRGEEKPEYTLVNLILTESDGKCEIVTVETGRPEVGGARKMMGLLNGKSQLYARNNGQDYSVLFATDDMNTVPVRFRTYEDDTFTLTWDVENGTLGELFLVDNITGQTIDMLNSREYKFEGRTSDYSSRFKLVFANGAEDEPAEGEVIDDIFAYQYDGNLMVTSEGHLEAYDMSGRLVLSLDLYGDLNTVTLPNAAGGVYMLRLTNNTDMKVQKIVIR